MMGRFSIRLYYDAQLGPALVAHRMKEMNGELQQLVHNVVPEKSLRPGARTLNFEEKRKLSVVRPKPYPGPKHLQFLYYSAAGMCGNIEHSMTFAMSSTHLYDWR